MKSNFLKQILFFLILLATIFISISFGNQESVGGYSIGIIEECEHEYEVISKTRSTCDIAGILTKKCIKCGREVTEDAPKAPHEEIIMYDKDGHWYECEKCGKVTSSVEKHQYSNNYCLICGYEKQTSTYYDEDDDDDDDSSSSKNYDELIVESWMKENKDLSKLAVSLRSESYDNEDNTNRNIYALNEQVKYYIDYKNGGKKTTKKITINLELPLAFKTMKVDGGTFYSQKRTITWNISGLDEDESGTKEVIIKYTSLAKKDDVCNKITPKVTIAQSGTKKDSSAVLNMIIKDVNFNLETSHEPYMFGDRNTGNFRPDDTITRAEAAQVFARVFLLDTSKDYYLYDFPDLDETYEKARKAIKAVVAEGLLEGYPDGTFKPNKTISVGEFITVIARKLEKEEGSGFEVKDLDSLIKIYRDKSTVYYISNSQTYDSHWAVPYATLLARTNLIPVYEKSRLILDDAITRAEVTELVNLYLFRVPVKSSSSITSEFPDVNSRHRLFGDIIEATRKSHTFKLNADYLEK